MLLVPTYNNKYKPSTSFVICVQWGIGHVWWTVALLGLGLLPSTEYSQVSNNQLARRSRGRSSRRRPRRSEGDSVGKYFGDAWSLAKRTAVGLNEIRKLINIETKFFETTVSTTVDSSGALTCCNLIAQGTDYTNRVGDSIKLQKIEFNGHYHISTNATTSVGTKLRLILLRDLQQDGTAPTVTEVLQTASEVATYNYLRRERFSILSDQLIALNQLAGNANGVFKLTIPHEGHVKFLGTSSAAGSMGYGSIYLLAISSEATQVPTIYVKTYLYFTDD